MHIFIPKNKSLVVNRTAWGFLAEGLYFQAYMLLAAQAKRYIRRRKIREYPWVERNKVV